MIVRLACIERGDLVNSFGKVGMVLWFQGCSIRCNGCHNPQLIPMHGGSEYTTEQIVDMVAENVDWLRDGYVVFLGGEPTDQLSALLDINGSLKSIGLKTVLYTGRTEEELYQLGVEVADFDIVKVGGYDETQINENSAFISENQYLLLGGIRHESEYHI